MGTDETIKFNVAPQKVKTTRSDDYREITQDRVIAGIRDGYFIYAIQNEVFDTSLQEGIVEGHFIDEVQVKIAPQQMVKMHKLFGQLIKSYEKIYGEIKTLEQIATEKPDFLEETSTES
jgi:hypothetical protein